MKTETTQLTFGEKLISLRETTGRTPYETAALLHKAHESYIKLEMDFIYPSESFLRKVAKLYDITYDDLLTYNEQPNNPIQIKRMAKQTN